MNKRTIDIQLRGEMRNHNGDAKAIELFDLARSVKAAARKLPCYGIKGHMEKGFLMPDMFDKILSQISYGDRDISVAKSEDGEHLTATVHVTTEHPAARKCDIIDLFGVAGKIGLVAWGTFAITAAASTSRLSRAKQAALLVSSADMDPRTDIGIQNMRVYNEAPRMPYLDFDGYQEASVLPSGGTSQAKLLTQGEARHAAIANR